MILLITHEFDQTGLSLLKWLKHLGKKAFILTSNDTLELESIGPEDFRFFNHTRHYRFVLSEKSFVIYRQGKFPDFENLHPPAAPATHKDFYKNEGKEVMQLLAYRLSKSKHLGDIERPNLNKLQVLHMAAQCGLLVPEYLYSNARTDIEAFYTKHRTIITKTIQPSLMIKEEQSLKVLYTRQLDFDQIKFEGDSIYPNFFQRQISKKMDIRVFCLKEHCYAMGIFSQNNRQTQTDYRHYDKEHPNRQVPVFLPENIKMQLLNLFKKLQLNYGSADFIYGTDAQFYFLEINPVGQFGVVSYTHNNFIERKIAQLVA